MSAPSNKEPEFTLAEERVVGMSGSQGRREIKIVRGAGGNPRFAFCMRCQQKFAATGKSLGLLEDLLWRKFIEHRCDPEDFSQPLKQAS